MKKLIVVVNTMLFLTNAYAYEVKPAAPAPKLNKIRVVMGQVQLEEIEDCKYPSDKDNCHLDEHGNEHCAVVQDGRC